MIERVSPCDAVLAGCGKTRLLRNTLQFTPVPYRFSSHPQDAQKGRPARPQQAKRRIVLAPCGEPLSAARTPLADFFRILLDVPVMLVPPLVPMAFFDQSQRFKQTGRHVIQESRRLG